MNPIFYLIKTHQINFTNLFVGALCHSEADHALGPCYYSVKPGGFFVLTPGETATALTAQPAVNFRNICWSDKISLLDQQIEQARTQSKILIFGTHHSDQIRYLKTHYQDQCFTIGINYQHHLYETLLNDMAKYHVFLLRTNQLAPSEVDLHNINTLCQQDLVKWYQSEFDRMKLIPYSSDFDGDHNIPVDDFLDSSKFLDHYHQIGFKNSDQFLKYYQTWSSVR
jgi:hypothetical protein